MDKVQFVEGVGLWQSGVHKVKFESVRHPGEDMKRISGYLGLNAEVLAKCINFGVINSRMK